MLFCVANAPSSLAASVERERTRHELGDLSTDHTSLTFFSGRLRTGLPVAA